MNDPFFSISSRKKLTNPKFSSIRNGNNQHSAKNTLSQNQKRNSFKSLKEIKTSAIIQNVKSKVLKPTVTMKPLIENDDTSSTSSSDSEEKHFLTDEDDEASKRFKLAKQYIRSISNSKSC